MKYKVQELEYIQESEKSSESQNHFIIQFTASYLEYPLILFGNNKTTKLFHNLLTRCNYYNI